MTVAYGPRTISRRRRSAGELATLDELIVKAIAEDAPVTLRGVFYRVAAVGGVDKSANGYRLVGRQLLALRRAGVVSYRDITDGTRYILRPETHPGLRGMLEEAHRSYRRSLWANQDVEVHVFTEKDAISGVVSPVTTEFDVPLAVVRGYCSESFAYDLADAVNLAKKPVFIYQLGDHDPSGLDAWRDLQRKVEVFAPDAIVRFERIAVTPAQIEEFALPTRPTKTTDTRAAGFAGDSVEVDAIPARILRALVRERIEQHIDHRQLDIVRYAEREERNSILDLIEMMGGAA